MKTIHLILCTAIVLTLMSCTPRQAFKAPEFIKIQDVQVLELTRKNAVLRVRTVFHNPNALGCTLENVTFSTFIDGRALGASRIQGTVELRGDENFELILDTRLLLESLPGVLISIFSKPEIEVEVKGRATLVNAVKNFAFDFNPKGRVEVKDRLQNLIRIKLFSKLSEAGLGSISAPF